MRNGDQACPFPDPRTPPSAAVASPGESLSIQLRNKSAGKGPRERMSLWEGRKLNVIKTKALSLQKWKGKGHGYHPSIEFLSPRALCWYRRGKQLLLFLLGPWRSFSQHLTLFHQAQPSGLFLTLQSSVSSTLIEQGRHLFDSPHIPHIVLQTFCLRLSAYQNFTHRKTLQIL